MEDTKKVNEIQKVTDNGTINFASDVIATIAGLATSEVKGVASMSGSGLADFLGRKNLTKGIKVSVEDGKVSLDASIVVVYGVKLQEVAVEVQKSISKAIETMTGLEVATVDVNIQNIVFEKEQEVPALPEETEE